MNYNVVVEKKITANMYDLPLKTLIGNMKKPKIIIMGLEAPKPKKKNIKTLVEETETKGKKFATSEEFFTYLDS